MRTGKLLTFGPDGRGGFCALDDGRCAWHKVNLGADWERVETPREQMERRKPDHLKRSTKRRLPKGS